MFDPKTSAVFELRELDDIIACKFWAQRANVYLKIVRIDF